MRESQMLKRVTNQHLQTRLKQQKNEKIVR